MLLYCVPSTNNVTNKAHLYVPVVLNSSLCMPTYALVPENFVHNPGLLSIYCDVTFLVAFVQNTGDYDITMNVMS